MKKFVFVLLAIIFAYSNIQAKKLFVEMEFHKNSIKLDDGTDKECQAIKGEDGKDLKFTSLIGALNYMSLQGWELVDTKSVISGNGGLTDTKVYYIFSKDISDEELEEVVNNSYKKR